MKAYLSVALAALLLPLAAHAQQTEASGLDERAALPATHFSNGFTYICGGIGRAEAERMKQAAANYDLMLTFAERDGDYLADVDVAIADAGRRRVLEARCDGPIMLVDVPQAGAYRIRAEAIGLAMTSSAYIGNKQSAPQQVRLAWPMEPGQHYD